MSGKLDQSLDDILKTSRGATTGRGKGRGARRIGRSGRGASTATPVGGVKKTVRPAKGALKSAPTGPSGSGDSRIQVSNLVSITTRTPFRICLLILESAQGCDRGAD
jgi:THO complex subunit 4